MQIEEKHILATRLHFSEIHLKCVEDAESGKTRVNDLSLYVEQEKEYSRKALAGDYDHTFTFMQYAYFLQTGEFVALLP